MLNPKIFKAYDIRGIYPTDIDEEVMETVVKAIYSFFVKSIKKVRLTVVLSRDMRISSPSLFEVAKKTLVDMGANLISIGLTSTPTFYFSIFKIKPDVGIQISASHNPKEYAGIKFSRRIGNKLMKISKITGMNDVKKIALEENFIENIKGGKFTEIKNILKLEIDNALKEANLRNKKKFKIIADPANAMGVILLEELFKRLPHSLIKMNFILDGTFPAHEPDPLQPKNILDLQKNVIKEKADLGIAADGDADRIMFIDEKGKLISPTLITCLIAQEILNKKADERIIVDIRYIKNVVNLVKKLKGITSISKVGHALITEQVNREDAAFAGESSGHYYFREIGGAESSIKVLLYVLDMMEKENMPISKIVSKFSTSIESGETNFEINMGVDSKRMLKKIAEIYNKGKISWLDGLSVEFPDYRFNIRTSNTEPLLRLNLEGKNEAIVKASFSKLKSLILSLGATVKE